MNTHRTTIRRGFTAVVAATAFIAFAACGVEVSDGTGTIGGSHDQKEAEVPSRVPSQGPRTSVPRTDFGDEYGAPSYGPTPIDKIDRTQDWH